MLWDKWANEQAIQDTELYLESIVPDSKKAWDDASIRFQREWQPIKKPTRKRTKAEISKTAAIRAHNDELTRAVKKSKAQYERWVRIQALWEDTKHRLNYK